MPTIDTNFFDFSLKEDNGTTSYDINISDVELGDLNLTIESNNTDILTVTQNWSNMLQQANYDAQTLDFNLTTENNATGVVRITIKLSDDLTKSKTFVDAKGNIETTVETKNGGTIKTTLGIDGLVRHEVKSKDGVTVAVSAIAGSKVEVDKEGNVKTTSTIEKDGFIYKAVVITDAIGKTLTKFIRVNVATGEESEIENTLEPTTPYAIGSKSEISELNNMIYIKTTTALDGLIV